MARNSSPDEITTQFPEKLKRARQLKDLTQAQLAHKVGADVQRISKYERGVMVPTTAILVRLADALGVTMDYLLRNGDREPAGAVRDPELLERVIEIDGLPEHDRQVLLTLIDAFIKKHRFEELAAS